MNNDNEMECEGDFMVEPFTVGDVVPEMEFSVFHNGQEKQVSFSDYKDKMIVLFFYPADFTFICPKELENLSEKYTEFQKEDTEVISVSTDTVFTHKAWLDHSPSLKNVKFPMASDANHQLSYMFGTLCEDDGLSKRGTFILDKDMCIKSVEINDNSIGRNIDELLRKVRAVKFVAEHGEKVCPPHWEKEGDDTLTPGMDLVGKI